MNTFRTDTGVTSSTIRRTRWTVEDEIADLERALRSSKEARTFSATNRQIMNDALKGMKRGMEIVQTHHAILVDLMKKTDPDRVRQDEDDRLGDSDTENGGHDINKTRAHVSSALASVQRQRQNLRRSGR